MTPYLYINSFIYLNVKIDYALLFNLYNKRRIIVKEKRIIAILKSVSKNKSMFFGTKLNNDFLNDESFIHFLYFVRVGFFGDIVNIENNNYPIQFPAEAIIEGYDSIDHINSKKYNKLKRGYNINKTDLLLYEEKIGTKITDNLTEITIHIGEQKLIERKGIAYQYNFPFYTKEKNKENIIFSFLYWSKHFINKLNTINIVMGDNHNDYDSNLKILLSGLPKQIKKNIYLFYETYQELELELKEETSLSYYIWIFDLNVVTNLTKKNIIWLYLNSTGTTPNSEDEIFPNSNNIFSIPYYNGSNISFLRKELSYTYKDLCAHITSERMIAANKILNTTLFGHLIIKTSGDVYSSINSTPIGNIKNDSVKELLFEELGLQRNWFKTRRMINPCKKCLYVDICPPISNIENYIGIYDFCRRFAIKSYE